MAYFDRYPNFARMVIGALAMYLFVLAVVNFYRYAGSPTDENWFSNPPSYLYVTASFSGQLVDQPAAGKAGPADAPDSVQVGDLLRAMNGQRLKSLPEVKAILQPASNGGWIDLDIFRPKQNRSFTYRVAKSALPDSFLRQLPPVVHVSEVFRGGASDRAGMKVGDLIFRINGQNFNHSGEANFILRQSQSGKTIAYEVIRDNRLVTLQVTLAKFGIAVPLIVLCLSGLVYMGTGTFIALQRPQLIAARLLGLALLLTGFFLAVFLLQRDAHADAFAMTRQLTMSASLLLGIAVWLHSGYYFPKERPEILSRRWIPLAPYGLAVVAFVLIIFISGKASYSGAFVTAFAMMFLACVYTMVVRFIYRKQRSEEHKKLDRIIKWTGWGAGALAFVLSFIFSHRGRYIQIGYIGLPLMLIPLAYLYTIGRYRLLEMDLRIRRNIVYTIVSSLWIIITVLFALEILMMLPGIDLGLPNIRLTGASIEIIDGPMPSDRRELLEKSVLMFLAIGLTFVFWKIGRAGQRFIDKKFYRAQYDYRRAASELADVMATKLTMIDLARGIVQRLAALMHLRRVGVLFFRDEKNCCCQEAYGFEGARWQEFCMTVDRHLINVIQRFRSESRFSVDYLPHDLKENFHRNGFRHIIPIRFKEKLVGLLLLGDKLSDAPFYSEDLSFLSAVAKQASVAIENAFLYEELAEQERLKHELAIARRIQLASLPQITPKIEGLDIAGTSIPATEVGGDYFDYLNGMPNEITVVVGDVSGKGTSAALYMSKVQGILRSLHGFGLSPRELFIRANQLLCQSLERTAFVTSIGADFDAKARRLVLARAGHLPLIYYNAKTRQVEKVTPRGLGLGLDNHGVFASELEEKVIQYEAGDIFLFVTDGVTEAQASNGGEFGEESLLKILEANVNLRADQIRDQVINAVKGFAGEAYQHDDQTVVVVKAV
jgi:serine phosphatase RsbU (regulator of sigma subunit)